MRPVVERERDPARSPRPADNRIHEDPPPEHEDAAEHESQIGGEGGRGPSEGRRTHEQRPERHQDDPGRGGFLDHHIQCGNSLLGATPALMARASPTRL